jgi:nicotinamide-nucleotide amidase
MLELAAEVGKQLAARAWKLTTAESCTGGGVAFYLTEIPGSSAWFERGFVTYSNAAKTQMLNVSPKVIASDGAVSEACARSMAEGALHNSGAQLSIAITGIAGPTGGTPDKPIGTVWFAWAASTFQTQSVHKKFGGDRAQIRHQAIKFALTELLVLLNS